MTNKPIACFILNFIPLPDQCIQYRNCDTKSEYKLGLVCSLCLMEIDKAPCSQLSVASPSMVGSKGSSKTRWGFYHWCKNPVQFFSFPLQATWIGNTSRKRLILTRFLFGIESSLSDDLCYGCIVISETKSQQFPFDRLSLRGSYPDRCNSLIQRRHHILLWCVRCHNCENHCESM